MKRRGGQWLGRGEGRRGEERREQDTREGRVASS